MRNLKRALSMIMAVAMMMSLVVFSASAASFTDDKDIANREAVDMAVALKIINGLPDGSFNPTGNVTRAEMAKMICVLLNGGNDPQPGAKTGNPTFNDIRGHWAENYIEYCVAEGIIAGMGDGTFQPNGNVTGTQAAKMLLVALGYRANAEDFNGANWAVRVNVRATQKKLYDNITVTSVNNALSRDNAAQMIWNALKANVVEYTYELITVDGQLQSVLTARDKAITKDGAAAQYLTLLADKYNHGERIGTLTAIDWSRADNAYRYTVSYTENEKSESQSFLSTTDYSHLFAMNVKAVYRTNESKTFLFGLISNESSVLATGTVGDFDSATKNGDTSFKFDGTKYNIQANNVSDVAVYAQNQYGDVTKTVAGATINVSGAFKNVLATGTAGTAGVHSAYAPFTVRLIDNDNDGDVDAIVYLPFAAAEVSAVNNSNVIVSASGKWDPKGVAGSTFDKDDHTLYSGIAKGDYVAIYAEDNRNGVGGAEFVELTSFEGKADGTRGVPAEEVRVNGNWYNVAIQTDGTTPNATVAPGNEYSFFTQGSYVFFVDGVSSVNLKNIAFVSAAQPKDIDKPFDADKAKLHFTDGTSKVVDIDELKDDATMSNITNRLVTFSEKNGEYTLTLMKDARNLGSLKHAANNTGEITKATSKITGKLSISGETYNFADDAVVFIHHKDGDTVKVKVITGKQAKDLSDDFGTTAEGLYEQVSGVKTAKVAAAIDMTSKLEGLGDDNKYGYIIDINTSTNADSEIITQLELWTADGKKEVSIEGYVAADVKKGVVISYTDLGDKEIEEINVIPSGGAYDGKSAITGIAGKEYFILNVSGAKSLTSDTEVIYVNTSTKKGVESASIITADRNASDDYIDNVIYVFDGDELKLLVVDINNKYEDPNAPIYTIANPTYDGNTVEGITITDVEVTPSSAREGDTIVYTVYYEGTATDDVTITITAGTNSTITVDTSLINSGDGAGSATFNAEVNAGNVGAASVALS